MGPGPGGLTRALLANGADHVHAVELDSRAIAALAELAAAWPGRLTVTEADALGVDPVAMMPAPRRIVANLPYNVGSPLLIGWLARAGEFDAVELAPKLATASRGFTVHKVPTADYRGVMLPMTGPVTVRSA